MIGNADTFICVVFDRHVIGRGKNRYRNQKGAALAVFVGPLGVHFPWLPKLRGAHIKWTPSWREAGA